jgi:hypothetical protein
MLIIMYILGWTWVPNYIDLCGVNLFRFLEPSPSLFGWVTNYHFLTKTIGNFLGKKRFKVEI